MKATLLCFLCSCVTHGQVLGDPVDVGQDFQRLEDVYFIGSRVTSFDTSTGQGTLQWDRYFRNTTLSFAEMDHQGAESHAVMGLDHRAATEGRPYIYA